MTAIIRSALTPILELWLRSQVRSAGELHVRLSGRDGELVRGIVPEVSVAGREVVYQDLSLTQVHLAAGNIHLNVPQLLRGEALTLLAPLQVDLELHLNAADTRQCLRSHLVCEALGGEPAIVTDADIEAALQRLLAALGTQFVLHELRVEAGACTCNGTFRVAASEPVAP